MHCRACSHIKAYGSAKRKWSAGSTPNVIFTVYIKVSIKRLSNLANNGANSPLCLNQFLAHLILATVIKVFLGTFRGSINWGCGLKCAKMLAHFCHRKEN